MYPDTNDPDLPKLWKAREMLVSQVASGEMKPAEANSALGKYADSLVWNRQHGIRPRRAW